MLRNYDIICIQEAWANNYEQYMDLFDGYNAFSTYTAKRAYRGRNSGGIIVYIKEWLSPFIDFMFKSEIVIFSFSESRKCEPSETYYNGLYIYLSRKVYLLYYV